MKCLVKKWTVMMKHQIQLGNHSNCKVNMTRLLMTMTQHQEKSEFNTVQPIQFKHILITSLHYYTQLYTFYSLRLSHKGKNKREEPKGIVFLSQLLLLFQHCHRCFYSKPNVSVTRSGTTLILESKCKVCNETMTWKSQPHLLGKFPA